MSAGRAVPDRAGQLYVSDHSQAAFLVVETRQGSTGGVPHRAALLVAVPDTLMDVVGASHFFPEEHLSGDDGSGFSGGYWRRVL